MNVDNKFEECNAKAPASDPALGIMESPPVVVRAEVAKAILEAVGIETAGLDLVEFARRLEFARIWYRVRMDLKPGASKRIRRKKGVPPGSYDMRGELVAHALGFGRGLERRSPFERLVRRLEYLFAAHLGIAPTLSGNTNSSVFIRFVDAFLTRCGIMRVIKGKEPQRYPPLAIRRAMSRARQLDKQPVPKLATSAKVARRIKFVPG